MIYLSISYRIWVAIVPIPILTHPNVDPYHFDTDPDTMGKIILIQISVIY